MCPAHLRDALFSNLNFMKRIECPKCGHLLTINENEYPAGRVLVFVCPKCNKQFKVMFGQKAEQQEPVFGHLTVLDNQFNERQELPLKMGDNVIGRFVKGTKANLPIYTSDPSIDTTHCVITLRRNKKGKIQYVLRDAPSLTGTFYQGDILNDYDRINLADESIINIGGATMIVHLEPSPAAPSQ